MLFYSLNKQLLLLLLLLYLSAMDKGSLVMQIVLTDVIVNIDFNKYFIIFNNLFKTL